MDQENKVANEEGDIECYYGKDMEDRIYSQPLLTKRYNTTSQIAIVGANACPVESLDYEIIENELFKQDWRSRRTIQIFQYVLLKWAFALIIGLGTGLVGIFNNIAVENISGFKLLMTTKLMLEHKHFMYIVDIYKIRENLANIVALSKLFGFEIMGIRNAGVRMGLAATTALVLMHVLEDLACRYYKAFAALASCNLALAAAAAALCAYIAPAAAGSGIPEVKAYLNGVDAHSILAPSTLFVKIFGSILCVSAGFVVGKEGPMVHTGACIASLIGQGGSRKYHLTWRWLRYFKNDRDRRDLITCGAAAGVASAFRAPVGGVLFALEEAASWWRSALLWRTFFTTAVVAIVLRAFIQLCSTGTCGLFGEGGLIMYDVSAAKVAYSVPDILAVILLGVIGGIFGSLYNYLVDKVLRTYSIINEYVLQSIYHGIITYGIAIPSGLFIPVILAGAGYGRLIGRLFDPITKLDVGLFALLGAASFLGGTMRMTVSLCVILLELTNDLLLLPLVMLVLLISKTVGDMFNHGVYDQIVKLKGLPYMEAHAEPYMKHLVARDVVSGPLITFSGVEKVGNILHALKTTGHNGFPVIDEPPFADAPELCGLVLRSHLLVLLKGKIFSRDRVLSGDEVVHRISKFDFAKAGSGKGVKLEDLDIKDEEMDMYVDLHPITNTSPYTVVETMSLAKAAVLFRQLGLRHMCVVPKSQGRPPIVGILTRHDFLPEHILGLYPHIRLRK
ncbi:hypothetical protein GOBAR_DD30785 [Gossypium barbadense]|nr:hypothetical protein GOBAR_DD30785 [Gossypium barbadense]